MSMRRVLATLGMAVGAVIGCGQAGVRDTPPPPISGSAVPVPVRRISSYELEVPHPGIAVIRDSAHWRELWRRYGVRTGKAWMGAYSIGGRDSLPSRSTINFNEHALIAVGAGESSGCGNRADFIRRLDRVHDTIVVSIDIPGALSMTGLCDGGIAPVDVVLISAAIGYISVWDASGRVFLPLDTTWWQRPHSFADVKAAPDGWFGEYRVRLAEDSTATMKDLRQLAMTLDTVLSEGVAWTLLRNPRVRADSSTLQIIANLQGKPGFRPYGDVVAAARQLLRD